ncbi:hypothetical protein [Halorubrum sp. BV1]|uniref:hypothetical protein n=1 Tax=Halorubrum sp. BV1 TaxID=1498500 RepID=UPI000678A53E|nr:hypothetical protein [Halorubrum sp. BV1]
MDTTQPFKINRTAAATVRDWFVDEHHTGEHGSPVCESLYHLAALLDDGLQEAENTLEVRVTAAGSDTGSAGTGTSAEPVQYVTTFECSICGAHRVLAASIQVCAYLEDCPNCGTANARFTANEIPIRISDEWD